MKRPKCNRIPQTAYTFGGYLADYLTGATERWLKAAPLANPFKRMQLFQLPILEKFRTQTQ